MQIGGLPHLSAQDIAVRQDAERTSSWISPGDHDECAHIVPSHLGNGERECLIRVGDEYRTAAQLRDLHDHLRGRATIGSESYCDAAHRPVNAQKYGRGSTFTAVRFKPSTKIQ